MIDDIIAYAASLIWFGQGVSNEEFYRNAQYQHPQEIELNTIQAPLQIEDKTHPE